MTTQRVEIAQVVRDVEIVVRAGDAHHPDAQARMQQAYVRFDTRHYPDAPGISVLFKPGATLNELAQEGNFPHQKLGVATLGSLVDALNLTGYQLVLFITPTQQLPDHHALAVAQTGQALPTLPDAAAQAILRVLQVVDNPYRNRP